MKAKSKQSKIGKIGKEVYPPWMLKIIQQRLRLEKKYKEAYSMFAEAYNDFISSLDNINFEYGTSFTIQQALEEFGGEEADLGIDDDDDEKE
jgi:hypothetical protein